LKKDLTQRRSEPVQRQLEFPQHGGARRGAGRKPKGRAAGASHATRPSTPARHPLLVTQRLCAGLPSSRQQAEFEVICSVLAESAQRDGWRIVHFSVQSNHLHYICEARDAAALTSGMKSLGVKLARRLNRLWKRTGKVLAERFHARALETPSEVRNALTYVLNNARKHGIFADGPDPFSSGPWFDGWKRSRASSRSTTSGAARARWPSVLTAAPETWLLGIGWRKRGLIEPRAIPGGKALLRSRAKAEARLLDALQRSLAAAARVARDEHARWDPPRPKCPA
jgi:REP element-mobilizing transposase RayT